MNESSLQHTDQRRSALIVCAAAMIALAVAMGVGRFAFTPLFPLMVRDGLLDAQSGALLAGSNYLGYLVGAVLASRLKIRPAPLMAFGMLATVAVTVGVGLASSVAAWTVLRFVAGILSAWTLVATTAWGLGWLASLGRPHLAGAVFAGVGLGIAAAGLFCLVVAGFEASALAMWVELGGLAALAIVAPLLVSRRLPAPASVPAAPPPRHAAPAPASATGGLIVCYALFGFGYILPATYLPALARQVVDDPHIFGWAWPLFGTAAALSTVLVSAALKHANRSAVWAACHLIMALGVLLPIAWPALAGVIASALLVGGTFMVITMVGMQEARSRVADNPTAVLGRMTAGFALGQLMGPVVSAAIGHLTPDHDLALDLALGASALGLLASAYYLWRHERHPSTKEHP